MDKRDALQLQDPRWGDNWVEVNQGLTNRSVNTLAIDPKTSSTLYAGTAGGVFKTVDGGGDWSAISGGLTNRDVGYLALDSIDPNTVFAGTRGNSVFVSRDGGETWE